MHQRRRKQDFLSGLDRRHFRAAETQNLLMTPEIQFLLVLASGLCALFVFVICKLKGPPTTYGSSRRSYCLPQAGGALPIIGHLHLFGSDQLTHKTLGAMADKYGPAFGIRLGCNNALVVSSWEVAKECFTVHDRNFSTKPSIAASRLLGYNFAMFGFAPYGSYWREIRKIVTLELLSNKRTHMLSHVRAVELKTSLRELHDLWVTKRNPNGRGLVDMKQWFGDLTCNTAVRLVGGKRCFGATADYEEEGKARNCKKVLRDMAYLFGVFALSDAIPYLGWFDWEGHEKSMNTTAKELDVLLGGWLEEHKQNRVVNREEGQDFMDVMLHILEGFEGATVSGFDKDTITKATCLNLIEAGTDSTMVTLTWTLSLLLNNPDVLAKVHDELDSHVGRHRHVEETDVKDLEYLQACVKETFRLYPPIPVIALRAAMADCVIAEGYRVLAGTRLMVNAWKIHRDERVWPEPHKFKPERFLTTHKNIDLKGQNFELIPFGSGRRACPAISLALQTLHLTLASLLHRYHVTKPSEEDLDMTESLGMTNLKATPLDAYLTPRLPAELYET